ncbi:nucleoside triphosphate pyrophosphohydrolase family protein [Flavobacterium soyae]|uniref:nucleoside triphosphate pyrophosphohydrolase family protein n=1 Tax=Flavobacterium soyae TaxID=2903098 RepID=UPI001E655854|nr:nucleoside triphosphate pyrophosphohydrolase family protein [Flavobacterium soyae]MCD9576337.1 nucleoside triphosphate pyrophosphohydrolase family protein [Flavobacterium soyae]
MLFSEYQLKAKKTIQDYIKGKEANKIVPFLGLIGEAGSVLTELKKNLRDGNAYTNYTNKLEEELGDVLWYISTIATENNLSLEDIAKSNLNKIKDRFDLEQSENFIIYDNDYPESEQFPREFEVEFLIIDEEGKSKVRVMNNTTEKQLGNDITDNSHKEDSYRFHDIFHFGYVAFLGWSPVIRKLMGIKRKSHSATDEVEDGARAAITEELISLYIYSFAVDHQLFKYSDNVDSEVLKTIQKLVSGIEVKNCTQKQWETAIINSYKVFNELKTNNGGRVLVSIKNKKLIYLGKS